METLSPREQRGLSPRSSCLRLLSDPPRASWYLKPHYLPQFGKLFLPQTGAARTPVPRPPEHAHPHSHPQILDSRRGGRASVRDSGGHLYLTERPGRGAPPRWSLVGEDPGPRAALRRPPGPSPVYRRGAEVLRGGCPSQDHARRAVRTRAPDTGPPDPASQSWRQPEAAAIYRGSHAQSLLAAAATAEYFAQIWLGPRRGGREPRE